MKHYIDIKLFPDPEFPATVLMNSLYTKLHKNFNERKTDTIGVSFPHMSITLGNLLRLHGANDVLSDLQNTNWIGGMHGYCDVTVVQSLPDKVKYRTVSRKQSTMSQSKLNRLLKRGSITKEDVKKYRAKMFENGLDYPYLELVSGSNGHKHRRYIELGPLVDQPVEGKFDQFGLSKTTTVPWF